MKRTIRLNESELKRMISESVKRVLRESHEEEDFNEFDEYNEASHKVANMIGDFIYRERISPADGIKGCELAIEQLGGIAY